MKFLKRISLFVLYPLMMFSVGFACNMMFMDYFYPGDISKPVELEVEKKQEDITQVAVVEHQLISANTEINVQKYNADGEYLGEETIPVPDKYVGMTRDDFAAELKEFNQTPPLKELELGLSYVELYSFSPQKIVIRKNYAMADSEEESGYFLVNENHRVVVYQTDLQNIYMTTDIQVEELPEELQKEIIQMKYVENEKELYNFLESYSS